MVRTTYRDIEADSPKQAAERVQAGDASHDEHEIEEGDEEYIEIISVDETSESEAFGAD